MSKTKKTLLSVLALLFAFALVFTACFALAGCGDSDDGGTGDGTTGGTTGGTTDESTLGWGWEYKYDATKNDTEGYYLWIWETGELLFGEETDYGNFTGTAHMSAGTNGYWTYENGEFVFAVHSYSSGDSYGTVTKNGSSADLVGISGSNTWKATITDISVITGTGYDFSTLTVS